MTLNWSPSCSGDASARVWAKSINNPAMSCKQRRETTLFLFVVTIYFDTFQVCLSVSSGQREEGLRTHQVQESTAAGWERIQQHNDVQQRNRHSVERVIQGPDLRKSNQQSLKELRLESAASPGESFPYFSVPELYETDSNFALNSLSWTIGDISRQIRPSSSESEDGYQADFTGQSYLKRNSTGFTHQSLFIGG